MRLITSLIIALVAAASASAASLQVPPPAVAGRAAVPTKKPSWEFLFDSPQAAMNPVTFKDRAYVTTNTTLYALDARSGKLAWSFGYHLDESKPFTTDAAHVAATDELVVIGMFDKVVAVFPNNGTRAWLYRPPSGKRPDGYDGVRVRFGYGGPDTKGIYITTGYSPLRKLSMTGYVMWTAPSSSGIAELHATEAKGLGLVHYVSTIAGKGSCVVAVFADTGAVVWQRPGAWTILPSDDAGIVLLQGKATMPDGRVGGTFTAVNLRDGVQRYQLFYEKWTHIDDFFIGNTLYTMSAPSVLPYKPTTFFKYADARHIEAAEGTYGNAQWVVPNLDFLFFTPCTKGIVNFGPQYIDGYDEKDGSHVWRYEGVAVNAGAVVESTDAIIGVLQDRVIAIEF